MINPISAAINLGKVFLEGRNDRKLEKLHQQADRASAEAKLAAAKADTDRKLELSDGELSALALKGQQGTWKDEFLLVVLSAPIVMLFFAGIVDVLAALWQPDRRPLDQAQLLWELIELRMPWYPEAIMAIVASEFGIRKIIQMRRG